MAEVIVIEFSASDAGSIYQRVNKILKWDGVPGPAVRPEGLISSIAGESGDKLTSLRRGNPRRIRKNSCTTSLARACRGQGRSADPCRVVQ